MKYIFKEIANLPEVFSLEDLAKVCHLAKRSARYYLISGLLPCENNGKKTKCYSIKQTDLITMLHDYEEHPLKYAIPPEWYREGRIDKRKTLWSLDYLPDEDIASVEAKTYYQLRMEPLGDLICCAQIVALTGYNKATVRRWCKAKKLKAHSTRPRIWVPKETVFRFLLSKYYNNICIKSATHLNDLRIIYKSIHQPQKTKGE